MQLNRSKKPIRYLAGFALVVLTAVGGMIYQYKCSPFLSDVFVMYPDGTTKQVSPKGGGVFYEANMHPDGTHVAYFGAKSGSPRIWVTDLRSGNIKPVTSSEFSSRHPSYSADGHYLAYASDSAFGESKEDIRNLTKV